MKLNVKLVIVSLVLVSVLIVGGLWVTFPFITVSTDKTTYSLGETVVVNYSIFGITLIPKRVRAYAPITRMDIYYQNGTTVYSDPIGLYIPSPVFYVNEVGNKTWDQRWGAYPIHIYPNITGTYTIEVLGKNMTITITD